MPYNPSASYYKEFAISGPDGAAVNADSLPVATANRNGTDDGGLTLSVTNLATGRYRITGTIPSTYVFSDVLNVSVAATVGGISAVGVVDTQILGPNDLWAVFLGPTIYPSSAAGWITNKILETAFNLSSGSAHSTTAMQVLLSAIKARTDLIATNDADSPNATTAQSALTSLASGTTVIRANNAVGSLIASASSPAGVQTIHIPTGSTGVQVAAMIYGTNGRPFTSLTCSSTGLAGGYSNQSHAITFVPITNSPDFTWQDPQAGNSESDRIGLLAYDASTAPGLYLLNFPDAQFASYRGAMMFQITGVDGMQPMQLLIQMTNRPADLSAGAISAVQNGLATSSALAAVKAQTDKIGTNAADSPNASAAQSALATNLDLPVSTRAAQAGVDQLRLLAQAGA